MADQERKILIDLEVENQDFDKSIGEVNTQLRKNRKEIKKLSKDYEQNAKEIAKLERENKELSKSKRDLIKQSNTESNSLNALRKRLSDLTAERNNLDTSIEGNSQRFEQLQSQIKETSDEIKGFEEQGGDFRRNVGNYIGGLDGIAGGFVSATQSALGFLATPIGAVLGVIAGAFLLVRNALSRNTELTNKLSKAVAPLTSLFDLLLKALEPLAEFLIEGIVVGLEAATSAFDSFLGLVSDGLQFLGFDEASESVKNLAKEVQDLSNLGVEILELEKSIRSFARVTTILNAELETQRDLFQQIADDSTLSFEQQEAAARKVIQLENDLFQSRSKQLDQQEELINKRVEEARLAGNLGQGFQDLLDQQAEIQAERIRLDNEFTLFTQQNAQLRRQLAQDIFEQDLDFAIDVGTRRTEEALKAAENEKLSFEIRNQALQEARRLDNEAFENQIRLFEQVGLSREKANELINESNAKIIADELKKTELSEIERNRFRELVLERQALNQAFADSQTALNESQQAQREEEFQRELDLAIRRKEVQAEEAQSLKERTKLLISVENARRNQLLLNDQLTKTQRKRIIFESEQNIINIRREASREQEAIDQARVQANLAAQDELVQGITSAFGQASVIGKAFALSQIVRDTARGISGAIAAGSGIPFPGNLAAIATGVASVLSGIAQARSVLGQDAGVGGSGSGISSPTATVSQASSATIIQPQLLSQFSQPIQNQSDTLEAVSNQNKPNVFVDIVDMKKGLDGLDAKTTQSSLG